MNQPKTVRQLLDRAAAMFGDKPAYVQVNAENKPEAHSFKKLKSDVDALLTALNKKGFAGGHIGVMGLNSYAWIVSYLASLCGLGVAVPIPADTPVDSLQKILKTADVTAVLADDMFANAFNGLIKTVAFSEYAHFINEGEALIAAGDDSCATLAPNENDFSKIIFTSGTTGERRGVMLTQANMMCIAVSEFVPYAGDVSVSILPLSHAFESVCHVLVMLCTGGTLHICSGIRSFPPTLASSGADSVFIVPALAEALLTRFRPFLDKATNLKKVICGGAPVPQALVDAYDKLGIDVLTGYGLSECSPLVSLNMKKKQNSTGKVGSYCSVRISDEGEIQIKGTNVMLAYYKNESATKDAFTSDGWLKTGDLGVLDDDNYLSLTGRIKNLIILPNGENVSPEEIENMLRDKITNAQDALCYTDGQMLCAKLFLGGDTSENALARAKAELAALNVHLPAYKRVAALKLTSDPIPVSATGKKIR